MKTIDIIKKYYSLILLVVVIVLSVVLFQTWTTLRYVKKEAKYQQEQNAKNLAALGDSITVEFNKKLKAYEYTKDNFVVQKLSDLEKYNKELASELKKVKGDVIAAVKTEAQVDLGTLTTSNDVEVIDKTSNYFGLKFSTGYEDQGYTQKIAGISKFYVMPNEIDKSWYIKPDMTVLDTLQSTLKITYGFKEFKDKYEVFAISQSNKVKLTELNGAYFISKQPTPPPVKNKKFGIGPYMGYGINTYKNDGNTNVGFGWSIGVSVHYDIFKF